MRISDWSSDVCSSDLLFHHIHNTVVIRRGLHASTVIELLISLCNRRLVRDGHHTHPSPQHAQRVDRIERLGSTTDLHDSQRAALCRTHTTHFQRKPVNLTLKHTRYVEIGRAHV